MGPAGLLLALTLLGCAGADRAAPESDRPKVQAQSAPTQDTPAQSAPAQGESGAAARVHLGALQDLGGFKVVGEAAQDYAGGSVASAGDVNGDGLDDLVVGAIGNDEGGNSAGAAYVIFGREGSLSKVNLGALEPARGFKIIGDSEQSLTGRSVASAGDVNGDGIDDLVIGAAWNSEGGTRAGAAYVIFGKTSAFADILLGEIRPSDGFKIVGEVASDRAGEAVSAAGDLNGDGLGDLVVGAIGNSEGGHGAGAAYVIFGKPGGHAKVHLGSLAPDAGFKIVGESGSRTGNSAAAAGDINGDGLDDVFVGAEGLDEGANAVGGAYVIFGKRTGFSKVYPGSFEPGEGFGLVGEKLEDFAGRSVSAAGDVNGDGLDDLIIGAYANNEAGSRGGAAYLLFGRRTWPTKLYLSEISPQVGIKIVSETGLESAGASVSKAGDMNCDGIDDVLVGAYGNDEGANAAGAAYILFGKPTGLTKIYLRDLGAEAGIKLVGEAAKDAAGGSVASAGDINGDGLNDLLIGASRHDEGGSDAGAAYVILRASPLCAGQ